MELIIAEKPSAAFDIARVLGARDKKNGFIEGPAHVVTWCVGHVVQLAGPAAYDDAWATWSLDTLPMLPTSFLLEPSEDTEKQWSHLEKLLKDERFTSVINACDAGREGELIFRNVYDLSGSTLPIKRLWLDDLTPAGVKKALGNIRPGTDFDALADAARSRAEADWLVGLNATRAMTLKAGGQTLLSVGRVQTPTLAMIVQRKRTIDAFVPANFWQVFATFDDQEGAIWEAKLIRDGGGDRFEDEAGARALIQDIRNKSGVVTNVEAVETRSPPPKLYDLTTLQREMNARFGLSAQQTLDCAQSLYATHKLLTYPRTSSRYLPETIRTTLDARLEALENGAFSDYARAARSQASDLGTRFIDDEGVSDHHAIIPTAIDPAAATLTPDEQHVYESVTRRFIAAFYPPARFAKTTISAHVDEHLFVATGTVRLEEGWQAVDPPRKAPKDTTLPKVAQGRRVAVADTRLHAGKTTPPKPYDEAALLGAMETAGKEIDDEEARELMKSTGLGTDATRAGIIETLITRGYIEREKKHLQPTQLGCELIDAIPDESLKSPELTGRWELALDYIAQGRIERPAFMAQVRKLTTTITENICAHTPALPSASPPTVGRCPRCASDVLEGKRAFYCAAGRDCDFVIFKTIAGKKLSQNTVATLLLGKTTRKLKGFRSKKGKKFSARLKLTPSGTVEFVFDE